MFESIQSYNSMNIILEGYQPTSNTNVNPKRPPQGGSALVPSAREAAPTKAPGQKTTRTAPHSRSQQPL
jgi:hypothetical protein